MASRRSDSAAARRELLNGILSSRQFAHAHVLKRVLSYLCERSTTPEGAPKEYEIAVQAMGRPASFDPRTDPIVRVSIASIRERLLAYFATEGKNAPLRLTVPKGQYAVVVAEAEETAPAPPSESALARFWRPYFTGPAANAIVYTEPLFFRDNKGHFFRDWYINDPGAREQIQKPLSHAGFGPVEPAYHYLSTGEVHCLLSISRMFHEMGVPVETRNSRISSWNDLRNANLILLGSPRTNTFLNSLQGEEPFVTLADQIENRQPQPGEERSYKGCPRLDGKLMRRTEYAVVTRRPGLMPASAITMIATNHGKAIEGAAHFLTLEDKVGGLLRAMQLAEAEDMPRHFQCLMRVDMMDLDDEVVETTCIAHRILRK